MIKVTYDSEVDAKYVSIKRGKIHETKIMNDWLFYDVNKKGEVLGVEILDSSKNEVILSTFDNELSGINFIQKINGGQSLNQDYQKKEEYISSVSAVLV